jgi:hypothetical protein
LSDLQVGTSNLHDSKTYYSSQDELVQHLWNKRDSHYYFIKFVFFRNHLLILGFSTLAIRCSMVFVENFLYFGDHLIIKLLIYDVYHCRSSLIVTKDYLNSGTCI